MFAACVALAAGGVLFGSAAPSGAAPAQAPAATVDLKPGQEVTFPVAVADGRVTLGAARASKPGTVQPKDGEITVSFVKHGLSPYADLTATEKTSDPVDFVATGLIGDIKIDEVVICGRLDAPGLEPDRLRVVARFAQPVLRPPGRAGGAGKDGGCLAMPKVTYHIIEHDGGWAYRVGDVISETFPSHDLARQGRRAGGGRAAGRRRDHGHLLRGFAGPLACRDGEGRRPPRHRRRRGVSASALAATARRSELIRRVFSALPACGHIC